jgi:hypothetical protein
MFPIGFCWSCKLIFEFATAQKEILLDKEKAQKGKD